MVRLSKKGLVLVIVLITVLLGGTGYLFWRVNESNQISPFDADAGTTVESECPDKQCATNGYRWQWKKNLGECKKVADSSCKTPKDDKNTGKCNGSSAEKCKSASPGAACGDGTCVSIKKDSNGVQCSCQGGVPKEPTTPKPPENSCEGGGVFDIQPAVLIARYIGENAVISGYAYDADGINKDSILVSVDGAQGVAATEVTDACPNGDAGICKQIGSAKKPVLWSYSFKTTKEEHALTITWSDTKGATGANCTKTTTIYSSKREVSNASWSVSSSSTGMSCQNTGSTNLAAVVDYAVTVKNVGAGEGALSRVEVILDDAVEDADILTEKLSPSATVSGSVITWDLSGAAGTFSADQSKVYRFSLNIPKSKYGQFTHEVRVVPSGTDPEDLEQTLSGAVMCTEEGEVPETAIFDSALGQIGFSIVLISLGYLYLKGYDKGVVNVLGAGAKSISDSYISVFGEEARVSRSRKKFEKKLK